MPLVHVTGLKETQAALKDIGAIDATKEVRAALKKGAEIIAADARFRVPSKSGRAAGSVRASVSGSKAYVLGGKKTVPYYGWLDFGTRTPQKGNNRAEGPWRGSGTGPKKGRFIYPAIAAQTPALIAHLSDAIGAVIHRNGLG